jgi:hypothetical protein
MRYRLWASMGLLCMAASQGGCASGLDFDHVSSGRHGADAGVRAADAGSAEPAVRSETAAPVEARPPASPHDGGLDASLTAVHAPDAHASDAHAPDAALAADPGTFSCANVSPKPFFCDDFESLALSSHWSDVEVDPSGPLPGGTIEIDSNASRAGQKSLLADVNEGLRVCDDCIELRADLTLPSLQGPTKLITEFDLRVEQIDPNEGRRIMLFQIWWGTPEEGFTEHTLQLQSSGGSIWTALVELATEGQAADSTEQPLQTQTEHQWQQTPALSAWVHVVYTLDVQDAIGTANLARLSVDNAVLFDGPLSFPLHNAKAQMEIGVPWLDMGLFRDQDTSKRWRIRYDNVLVRYEPR